MTPRLPGLSADDALRALRRAGFTVHRVKGSHHHLRHPQKPALRVVIPIHRGDLGPGTLRSIVRQAGMTVEEFLDLL